MSSFDIAGYWNRRYSEGRDSGEGSRGENAIRKAEYVNQVIARNGVQSVIDWGCGDGQVLQHITTYVRYVGVDIARSVLNKVSAQHPERFFILDEEDSEATFWLQADMSLSMDVMFHLVNDNDYVDYLNKLFNSARKLVLIYSTNYDGGRTSRHVLRREFTPDVREMFPHWDLAHVTEFHNDPGHPHFFTYRRKA